MNSVAFDTLKYADTLKAAGVPPQQAEAEARALAEAFAANSSDLATKFEIREVRSDIDLLRKDIQALELRLTIKLSAVIAAATGIILAVLRLPH